MKKWSWIAAFLIVSFSAFSTGFSQEAKPKMRQEIVKLKYLKGVGVLNVLYTFLSPAGKINPTPGANLLTISDYPENVEKILAVLRELDVKPVDLQFTIQLVLGSRSGQEATDAVLKDDSTIKELATLLRFNSFSLLDASLIRAIDQENSEVTMGNNAELRLELKPKYVREDKGEIIQVEARLQKRGGLIQGKESDRREWTVLLSSNFTMKSDEKTVVGVSRMDGGDKALILVISAQVVK